MACKRSSVRLRYSPPDYQGFTKLRKAFFYDGNTMGIQSLHYNSIQCLSFALNNIKRGFIGNPLTHRIFQ